jgi:hypothetical protein
MSESRIICYKTPTQYAYRTITVEGGSEAVGKPRYFKRRYLRDISVDTLAAVTGFKIVDPVRDLYGPG